MCQVLIVWAGLHSVSLMSIIHLFQPPHLRRRRQSSRSVCQDMNVCGKRSCNGRSCKQLSTEAEYFIRFLGILFKINWIQTKLMAVFYSLKLSYVRYSPHSLHCPPRLSGKYGVLLWSQSSETIFLVNIQTDIVNWDQTKSTKHIKGLIYQ